MRIEGYEYPDEYRYDESHAYACLSEDGVVTQGLTDLGQDVLGNVLYVELPYIGREIKQGERLFSVQALEPWTSLKRIKATISGKIVAINEALLQDPGLVNRDPYEAGWIARIEPVDLRELESLHKASDEAFMGWVRKEIELLGVERLLGKRAIPKEGRRITVETQFIEPQLPPPPVRLEEGAMWMGRYQFPKGLRYDLSHSYARLGDDGLAVQGLTDLGQGLLGETLFVELPYLGRKIKQGDRLLSIQPLQAGMSVRRINAAVSGEIVAVNQAIVASPSLINEDPYGRGWLIKVVPDDVRELDSLLDFDDPRLAQWAWAELEALASPFDYLEQLLGERATRSELEKELYSRDLAPVPPLLANSLGLRTTPDIIVRPKSMEEVAAIMVKAAKHDMPVTPRASASTAYFDTVPVKGGMVMDLNGLRGEPRLNEDRMTVTVRPAMRWRELDDWLRERGYAAKSYPTSAPTATVGGWLSMEGYGVGSIQYGSVHEQMVRIEVVLPDGRVMNATRDSDPPIKWFTGTEGTLGIITECELEVRTRPMAEGHHLIAFKDTASLAKATRAIVSADPRPYYVHFAEPSYLHLLDEAGFWVPSHRPILSVNYEGTKEEVERGAKVLKEIIAQQGGEVLSVEIAQREWNDRFEALRAKRTGPSLLAAEVWLPVKNLALYVKDVERLGWLLGVHFACYGHVVTPEYATVFSMYATNEKQLVNYVFSLSLTKKLQDVGAKYGGHPYGIGVWNTPYLDRIFSVQEIEALRERKQALDPKDILNPGKLYRAPALLPPPLFRFGMNMLALSRAAVGRMVIGLKDLFTHREKKAVWALEPQDMLVAKEPLYAGLESEALICARCGYCRSVCPIYDQIGWESSAPRGKISVARNHFVLGANGNGKNARLLEEYARRIYQCTLCGRCREVCPTHIDTRSLWLDLRGRMVKSGLAPESFERLKEMLGTKYNISDFANDTRLIWADRLDKVPEGLKGKERAKVLYFVGCVASFFPMAGGIPRSMVQIMDRGNVDFTVLGGEEWCCGFPLVSAGMEEEARKLAEHNIVKAKEKGIDTLIATCPSCYHVWKNEYKQLTGRELDFEVLHASEYLARLMQSEPFRLQGSGVVTYHDPCDLGRNSGIYEPPRRVIEAIPGVSLVEMPLNRENALCCGGGGNLEMVDTNLVAAISKHKVEIASQTGAETIISACQQCKRTITAAVKAEKLRIKVLDVTEVLWQAVEAGATEKIA